VTKSRISAADLSVYISSLDIHKIQLKAEVFMKRYGECSCTFSYSPWRFYLMFDILHEPEYYAASA
jgi:hypothetical protein